MDTIRTAFESYYSIHPATVESLRKDDIKSIDQIRSYLAKPLLRLENVPLKLRDLEKWVVLACKEKTPNKRLWNKGKSSVYDHKWKMNYRK